MVLDDLGTSLRSSLDKLQGKSRLSESDVEEIVKEIQRSLSESRDFPWSLSRLLRRDVPRSSSTICRS